MEVDGPVEVELVTVDEGDPIIQMHLHGVVIDPGEDRSLVDWIPEPKLIEGVDVTVPPVVELLPELEGS